MGIIKLSINTKLIFEGSNALPLSYPMKTRGYQVLKRMVLLSVGHSTLLIIGFLLLSTTSVFSQSKSRILLQLDSAYQAANEVEKAAVTISMAQFYASYNLDSARWVLERGLKHVTDHNLEKLKPRLLNGMGITYYIEGDYSKAAEYYEQSLLINEKFQDSIGLGVNYSNLSNVYQAHGKPVESLSYFHKAIELASQQKDSLTLAEIYNNLSNLYFHLNESEKALQFLRKSVQLYELIGAEDLATTYNNLGVGFSTSMNYDSAFYYYKKAYQFLSETKDLGSQVLTLGNIAQVKYQMGQIDTALILSKKVLQLSANYFSLPQIIQAHNTITRIYFQYGELDSAEYHAQKVMELAIERS